MVVVEEEPRCAAAAPIATTTSSRGHRHHRGHHPGAASTGSGFTRPPALDLAIVRPPVVEEPRRVAAALVGPCFHYKIHPLLATPVTDKMGKK